MNNEHIADREKMMNPLEFQPGHGKWAPHTTR
jgi:hypothetical protein